MAELETAVYSETSDNLCTKDMLHVHTPGLRKSISTKAIIQRLH